MDQQIITTVSFDEFKSIVQESVKTCFEFYLSTIPNQQISKPSDPLQVKEVCVLTGLARPTIYKLVQHSEIPYFRRGRLLYFDRDEILQWMGQKKPRQAV